MIGEMGTSSSMADVAFWQILLQKSAAVDWAVERFCWGMVVLTHGSPTHFAQLPRHAMHRT